jgi:hypothetical protein
MAKPSLGQKPPTADVRSYHNPSASNGGGSQLYQKNLKYLVEQNQHKGEQPRREAQMGARSSSANQGNYARSS